MELRRLTAWCRHETISDIRVCQLFLGLSHVLPSVLLLLRAITASLLLGLGANVVAPLPASALPPGAVTITAITPVAPLDANNACGTGPRSMYLEVQVTNPAGGDAGDLTGVSVTLNAFSNAAFVLDAGESPARYLGDLPDGTTAALYWYVNYPCTIGAATDYTITVISLFPINKSKPESRFVASC
jgi:hypothetical protein